MSVKKATNANTSKEGTLVILTKKNRFHCRYKRENGVDNITDFPTLAHDFLRRSGNERFRETRIIEGGFQHVDYHPTVPGKTFLRVCAIFANQLMGSISIELTEKSLEKYRIHGVRGELPDGTKFLISFPQGNMNHRIEVRFGRFYYLYVYVH